MTNFRTIDRQPGYLLPPSVDEWLPEKHLARFIVEVIDGLDLGRMSGAYRGSGSAWYHPRMLLGLLVYGYATGAFSSRKLERATYDSAAVLEGHREAVRRGSSGSARDGRSEDGHDRTGRDEDSCQRQPAQRAFL